MKSVSIVIPTKNGGTRFADCLEVIYNQKCDFVYDVIIVDSGSLDDTTSIAKEYGTKIRSIRPYAFTHGGARNLGASMSNSDYIVFCNQDVLPFNESWLENLLSPIGKTNVVASFSRQLAPAGTPTYEQVFLDETYPAEGKIVTKKMLMNRGPGDVVLFTTVSGATTRDIWKTFRFSEDIIMSEDQEFGCRLLLSGFEIAYAADSIVYHSNNYNTVTAFRRYFDSGWSLTYMPPLRVNNRNKMIGYVSEQSRRILQADRSSAIDKLSSLFIFGAKVFGFGLGQTAPRMPEALRTRISYTKNIVSNQEAV